MVIFGAILVLTALTGITITDYWVGKIRQELIKDSATAIQSASVQISSELNELELTDDILAGMPWVASVLESGTSQDRDRANDSLQHFNKERNMTVCYILDREGTTVASSNYREEDSFAGKNYSFRKYFNQAIRGIPAKDFALGITSLKKGLYVGSPVRDSYNRVIGVAVVKKDLDSIENQLKVHPPYFFINHSGIILLSSPPSFSMKNLWPTEKKITKDAIPPGKNGDRDPNPFFQYEIKSGMEVEFQGETYLVNREFIGEDNWSIIFLTNMRQVMAFRIGGLVLTASTLCLLILINLAVHSWGTMPEKMDRIHKRANSPDESNSHWF